MHGIWCINLTTKLQYELYNFPIFRVFCSVYNTHTHEHHHTLHVYNDDYINVHLREIEHYTQNEDYIHEGVEVVCDAPRVSGNWWDFKLF